jgi:hypothetical protein
MRTADHAGDRLRSGKLRRAALVRSAVTDRIPALADLGRVHIIGIPGSGMSALRILFDRAVPVSGCEARESITVAGLRAVWPQVVRPAHGSDVVLSPARCLLRGQPRNLFKETGEYIVPAMIALLASRFSPPY